jgi:hypothetical protein
MARYFTSLYFTLLYFTVPNLKGKDRLEDAHGRDGRIILEWILEKQGGKLWIGFIWLKIGTSGRLL